MHLRFVSLWIRKWFEWQGLALFFFCSMTALADDGARLEFQPRDNGAVLLNPDMGWMLYFYADKVGDYGAKLDPSDTVQDFPGLSTVYLRIPWALLEPEEGNFNWPLLDTPAQRWIAGGKKIAIRITSTESELKYATPEWVREAGAAGQYYRWGRGGSSTTNDGTAANVWEPHYGDPVFLSKLEDLVRALAERYDGNPNVAFVDIGSFGLWGEGHRVLNGDPDADAPIYRRHTDLYLKYFHRSLLTINDDTVGPRRQGDHFPTTDYALTHGVTLRDDSILVSPPPHSWYHAGMAQAFWPERPVILEHQVHRILTASGQWRPDLLAEAVEAYHASYLSIHGWPRLELASIPPATLDGINRRLGYRLQLRRIDWPAAIVSGRPFDLNTVWADAGVAPCYPGGYLAITLKDAKGGIVSVLVDDGWNLRDLKPGPPGAIPEAAHVSHLVAARFGPVTLPGNYDLYVSVGRSDGTPTLALPLDRDDGQRRYKVGRINLVADPESSR